MQQHASGHLDNAEGLYERVLGTDPNHAVATHLLGVIAHQRGDHGLAADLIGRALAIEPGYAQAHNNLGLVRHAMNLLGEAHACYLKALAINPDYAEAYNNLGNVLKDMDELEEALANYDQAINRIPHYAEALCNRGLVLQALDRFEESVAACQQAVDIAPDFPEAYANLGSSLKDPGRLEEAAASYEKALSLRPDYVEAYNNLGLIFHDLRRLEDAASVYRQGIAIAPGVAPLYVGMGKVLRDLGVLAEAERSFRQALEIEPELVPAFYGLAKTLGDLGRADEAASAYRGALAIDPNFAEAHNALGILFQYQGRLVDAATCYRNAFAATPTYAQAYRHMANVKKFEVYDDDIKAMEDFFGDPTVTDEQKMHLAFGLGKAFEDLKDFDSAFSYFVIGNDIKRRSLAFDIEQERTQIERLADVFTADYFSVREAVGSQDATPIFVLGMPRSGTTLVEQILASHPEVHGAGELTYVRQIVEAEFGKPSTLEFPAEVGKAGPERFSTTGEKYITKIRKHASHARFITDKMPYNFKHIGFIKLMLPNAKVIHCRRQPMDTCLSLFKNCFSAAGNDYAYDLSELGTYYGFYDSLIQHWHAVLPGFLYDIQYEDLVADPEGQARALVSHCKLTWDDACLDFHKTERPVTTASAAQVRRPIYKDSVQSWRRYEDKLSPLLEALSG